MLHNPTSNLNVLDNPFAEIKFKQIYHSNHSELGTFTYELSFATTTNTITSNNIEIPRRSRRIYVHSTEKV